MRFAFKTANEHNGWAEILSVCKEADSIDLFEAGWLFDHFYPIRPRPGSGGPGGPCLEGLTMLTALAQATQRLRQGIQVSAMPYRHQAVLANMAATVDIISEGRLNLGVGAGGHEQEAAAYGIEMGSLRERFDRFDEGCEVLVSLLCQETTDFHGTYYNLTAARCDPKGPQRPHPPIMIGGTGEKRTLGAVARYAQLWDAALARSPDGLVRKREVLREQCQSRGREPGEITITYHIWVEPSDDPQRIAAQVSTFADAGLDMAIMDLAPPLDPRILTPLAETLTTLAA
jgi:alkanesulfonate monooxygenase SsuD/methylene tetrahydromethanopterin reductase-like flavin-dependent oxidoreductase (luciferase family)